MSYLRDRERKKEVLLKRKDWFPTIYAIIAVTMFVAFCASIIIAIINL